MGYDLDRFTCDIDEELKCPICCGVLEDPLQGTGCEHVYCRKCIVEWMNNSETCPVDRNHLKPNQLQVIPRIVRNLLNHLRIKCDFHHSGCPEVVRLEELPIHRSNCTFNPEHPVPCPKLCGASVPKNILDKHDCIRDLRSLLFTQQKEISDLKATLANLIAIADEQKELSRSNQSSLTSLNERYDHLKMSIKNLEVPIKQILNLAGSRNSNSTNSSILSTLSDAMDETNDESDNVKDRLTEETTVEIYISNLERTITPGTLQEYLLRCGINVISCKEALCRGWKNDFRATVFKSDCSKILKPDLWPKGVIVFICGEYYSTRIEGSLDSSNPDANSSESSASESTNNSPSTNVITTIRACVPPWMMS